MDPELTQALLVSKLLVSNKVINDMVENITATSVGGGLGAMRSFSQGN